MRNLGSDSSKPNFGPKNNTFLFCENEKQTKKFTEIYSKHFDIYKNKKYILVLFLLLKNE